MTSICSQFVKRVPKESCEMSPREVCRNVIVQYPSLQMERQCQLMPRETCTPERVQPQMVTRPVIKKLCTRNNDDTENQSIEDYNNEMEDLNDLNDEDTSQNEENREIGKFNYTENKLPKALLSLRLTYSAVEKFSLKSRSPQRWILLKSSVGYFQFL